MPLPRTRTGSARIRLLGAPALSRREQPRRARAHSHPEAAAGSVHPELSNPIRNIMQEESSSSGRAASRLPASRQHHLGAERDRFMPARSRAGRLLVFFQESHTSSSSHPLLLQTFPYHGHPLLCLALAENHSSELHRGAGDTLQRVSISYCKALLCFVVFFFFFSLSDTALQCCVSLSAPFISISRLRSAQLPALFSGHPTEPSCPSAPRDAAPHPSGRNNRGVVLACSQHLAPFLLGGPQLLPPPPRSPLGCGKPCQHQPLHCSAHFQH